MGGTDQRASRHDIAPAEPGDSTGLLRDLDARVQLIQRELRELRAHIESLGGRHRPPAFRTS